MVYAIFEDNVDLYFARTRVLERMSLVSKALPTGVVPTLGPDATGVGHVFWYTVESPTHSLRELRSLLMDRAASLFESLDERNTRTQAEFTGSELISLAEACKWHQKHAASVLKPRSVRHWGLNPFIGRVGCKVIREPLGKVLIIGTWNYPAFQ